LSEFAQHPSEGHASGTSGNAFSRWAPDWLQNYERRRTALCASVLLGLLLLFYYRLWWPGLILIKRDAFRFYAPIKRYVAERLLAGELPQWFPYESLGRSVIGSAVSGVFHPFTALYLFFPSHDALRLTTLLTCLMGGLGAFALGRVLRFSRAGALVAGLAFACSGYVASMTEAITYLYGICAMPLFCAALMRALDDHPGWVVAPAAIWATVFLNGDIQTGYYYGFLALFWAVTDARVPRALARVLCAGLLAALLAGVQLAPSAAAFIASERADPARFHDAALTWSMHPLRVLTVVASPVGDDASQVDIAHFFFGSPPAGQAFVGMWADSLYLGVSVVGLACAGIWHRRDLYRVAWLGGIAFWLALGVYGGLYEVFYRAMPLWSAFRYPEKLMGVVTFSIAMLAGAGVDALRIGRSSATPWLVLAALFAGLCGVFRTEIAGLWSAAYSGAPAALAGEVADSFAQALMFCAVAAVGVGAVVVAMRRGRLPETVLLGVLIVTVFLDLSRVNQEVYHTAPVEVATFMPGLAEALERHGGTGEAGHFRIFSYPESRVLYPPVAQQTLNLAGLTSLALRQALQAELNAEFRIESVNVYLPGQNAGIGDLLGLVKQDFWVWAQTYARLNVAYFVGLTDHFSGPVTSKGIVAVLPSYGLALVKNPVVPKPRAYLSKRPKRTASPVDLVSLSTRADFLADADLIETSDEIPAGPVPEGQVLIERYTPEEVRVRVSTPKPSVLVLLDAFEDGWRASLENGEDLPIRRANALVRAVTVPAGTHHVTFTYRTPLLVLGAWLSLAGVLVCAGLLVQVSTGGMRSLASRQAHGGAGA